MSYDKEFHEWARLHPADVSAVGINNLLDEIERLQELNRWIPVSERLPLPAQKTDGYMSDSSDIVHVYPRTTNDRAVCYLHYLGKWSCSAEVNVTHWRPLSQPPEEQE